MSKKALREDKLLPLRKFVIPDLYSVAYLSQLVQRKKLRSKKIGRNYFTSQIWFDEYLAGHAQDRKIEKYQNYLKNQESILEITEVNTEEVEIKPNISFVYKIAMTVAVFVMLIFGFRFVTLPFIDKGQIAGESDALEGLSSIATSTIEVEYNNKKLKEAIEILKQLEKKEKYFTESKQQ